MKTASVRELRNQYLSVLRWVEAGEEVRISRRGVVIARLVPEQPARRRVDWSKSAAAKLDRRKMPRLTARQSASILAESRGSY